MSVFFNIGGAVVGRLAQRWAFLERRNGQTARELERAGVGAGRLFNALRSCTLAASAPEVDHSQAMEAGAGRCVRSKGLVPPSHQTAGGGWLRRAVECLSAGAVVSRKGLVFEGSLRWPRTWWR